MKKFTKDQLIARISQVTAINKYRISRDPDADGLVMDNELFAIALAVLTTEPVVQLPGGYGTYHCRQMLGAVECECTWSPAAPEEIVNRTAPRQLFGNSEQLEPVRQPYKLPEGWAVVPRFLSAENGGKASLAGEFSETKIISCPECFGDEDCESCDGSGQIEIKVPVSWTTIKAIWAKGVDIFALVPQQEAK
jgi:hypothetical protein